MGRPFPTNMYLFVYYLARTEQVNSSYLKNISKNYCDACMTSMKCAHLLGGTSSVYLLLFTGGVVSALSIYENDGVDHI